MTIYTIGHSTRSFEDLVTIIKNYGIKLVVDVRRFPKSTKFPHFNKEFLQEKLSKEGISYVHYPELGGFRKEGYENFAKRKEFRQALKKLLEIISGKKTTILCAEWNVLGCHRWYIANALYKLGHEVIHLVNLTNFKLHKDLPEKKKRMICGI